MKLFKNITYLFTFFILCLFASGCETKKSELQSISKDGKSQIIVTGTKSFMEPWNLTIEIKKGDKSDKLNTELYADEINTENVAFVWQDDNTCIITLTAQDDTQRTVHISI